MTEVITAVLVCSAVSAVLAALILIAAATIGNYGECEIDINDGAKKLKVEGGQSLLATLNAEGIFIPSACGGKGSCGLCKIKVSEGAGDPLPTELAWLNSDELKDSVRLACQVKVRNRLRIRMPEEYFQVKQFHTRVESIVDLTHDIKEVTLKLETPHAFEFRAGQFMQIMVPRYELSKEEVYRAYSLSSSPDDHQHMEFQIRLVPNGICTTFVHKYLKVGDPLSVNGPYGDFYLRDSDSDIILIAGGSGMAPIKSILMDMKLKGIKRKTRYFFGAVARRDLFHLDTMLRFEQELHDFKFIPALSSPADDDRWDGETGLITEVLCRHLEENTSAEAYLCGSPGMINACIKVLHTKGLTDDTIFYDKFA